MIQIYMGITKTIVERSGAKFCQRSYHIKKERIGGDIKRDAEKEVGRPLIDGNAQVTDAIVVMGGAAAILVEDAMKLKQDMAPRECTIINVAGIPGGNYVAARVRILVNAIYGALNLVYAVKVSPLDSIGVGQDFFTIGRLLEPCIPNMYIIIYEVLRIFRTF